MPRRHESYCITQLVGAEREGWKGNEMNSKCPHCEKPFKSGDKISQVPKGKGRYVTYHYTCIRNPILDIYDE